MAWNPNIPAVTNRVQDDLDAIRENFQHLDQLAERVDELQTVSELAERVDELQTVSELAPIANDLQTVSGLAPVAGELQTVSELAQITDDLQAASALAPYVQALLDSRIVEMGSNANGEYVRWENGLQVCTFIYPGLISVDPGSYAYYDWTPPAQFVEFYAVLMVPMVTGGDIEMVSQTHGVLNTNTRAVLRNNAGISRNMRPHFIAIGRWK